MRVRTSYIKLILNDGGEKMDLKGKNLWQVGAGDTERSYGNICIDFDIMMVGPGRYGPFKEEIYAHLGDIKESIKRFYHEAKKDDIVLLRLGTSQILAVGIIADDSPSYLTEFGDIDNWDLQHVRRVRWLPNTAKVFPKKTFGGQVRTFARVEVSDVLSWVGSLSVPDDQLSRKLAKLPIESQPLDIEQLGHQLFIEGLSSDYIDNLTKTLESIRRVAVWYDNKEKRPVGRPSEQETVCYLVVPLLFSLGWSHQTTAIQWNKVDVALFSQMPSTDENLECVVEAKSLDKSVFTPVGQALTYAQAQNRKNCRRIFITDGIRYSVFERENDNFSLKAYLNILNMRKDYPLYRCAGAVQAIIKMAKFPTTS